MEKISQKLSFTDRLVDQSAEAICQKCNLDRIEQLKLKLGLNVFVINVTKLVIIYFLAYLFQLLTAVIIFHVGFMMVRTFSYGSHAKSSQFCTIFSAILFLGCAKFCMMVPFSLYVLMILFAGTSSILWIYAPGVTKKNKIRYEEKKKLLRQKALCSNMIVFLISLGFNQTYIANLLMTGAFVAAVLTMPVLYKLLGDEKI
ncbi:accessory gene regulator AgrB [Candidatus Enterococcus mansonii]|uniref:AgrB-like protein n=1 Tax=Candidatus Enterococcus mansonii TaxID=1834181 RepID=A0A242CCH6_9ENTE|nr:accessory gene regulator AgrB [Enterococcus sp. 4G2_DIV0659]OTO07953.1 hypothetical protein A5880_002223 [Enterococcus sp. 4G2_DIV0659]